MEYALFPQKLARAGCAGTEHALQGFAIDAGRGELGTPGVAALHVVVDSR
jgi:hypothetical protein